MPTPFDIKNLTWIKTKLSYRKINRTILHNLVNDLSGLIDNLEGVPTEFINEIRKEMNTLDLINYDIADESINVEGYQKDIEQSFVHIKSLVTTMLESYVSQIDPDIRDVALKLADDWVMCPYCQEAWQTNTQDKMVICPKCSSASINPA